MMKNVVPPDLYSIWTNFDLLTSELKDDDVDVSHFSAPVIRYLLLTLLKLIFAVLPMSQSRKSIQSLVAQMMKTFITNCPEEKEKNLISSSISSTDMVPLELPMDTGPTLG